MRKSGSHPDKALTALKIRSLSKAGRYADGNGLYLVVDASGAKRWMLRTVAQGRRRDVGLGSTRLVSLAEARDRAASLRKVARDGGDPVAERRRASIVVPTFEKAARNVHEEHRTGWRNGKHADQWLNTLTQHVFPTIGSRPVNQIETSDVLRVLSPIWLTKPETARRVKQRIGLVLDWAKTAGHRAGDNPADGVSLGLPKQRDQRRHFKAMPYAEIPAFLKDLWATEDVAEIVKLAFEFLILTAARTSEVVLATWDEIDIEQKIWTIPGKRMKAGRDHRVPLSPRAIEILARAKELSTGGDYVFPGRATGKPLSNMAFLMVLRRLKVQATAHGFRLAFRDWAAERTNYPRDVCEMALAHTIKNKVEAAYRRGDLLDKRRSLMETWATYAHTTSADVVTLRTG